VNAVPTVALAVVALVMTGATTGVGVGSGVGVGVGSGVGVGVGSGVGVGVGSGVGVGVGSGVGTGVGSGVGTGVGSGVGAGLTVTGTVSVTVLKLLVSMGVKVICWFAVPTLGTVSFAKVNANVPLTLALPPLRTELLRACPNVIELAVGSVVMVGVALATVTLTFAVAVV